MATFVISGGTGSTGSTGSTDGIGRALAVHYLRAGHTVVVIGRSRAKFEALCQTDTFAAIDALILSAAVRSADESA